MAYSSLSDARSKVTNPREDNSSATLYADTNVLDSSNTFYSNSAKTTLASAGNYVVATNYKTYYVTLNSSGKIVGTPSVLMPAGTDTSWVEDRLKDGDTNLVSNNLREGGTTLILSNDLKLTDNDWTLRPYTNGKAWIIDTGDVSTSPITNIDLSAMKGYDLRLITGEYKNNKFISGSDGYVNTVQAIIHLAPDAGRPSVIGNKTYFFRPDYWIPSTTHNEPSFFRRMPNITPIIDSRGVEKSWTDLAYPLHDISYPGTHSTRTSTVFNKGATAVDLRRLTTKFGNDNRNNVPFSRRHNFDGDIGFRTALGKIIGPPTIPVVNNYPDIKFITITDEYQHRITALLLSMLATTDAARNSFSYYFPGGDNGKPAANWDYNYVNPYRWETRWGAGDQSEFSITSQILVHFNKLNANHAKHVQYDFEHLSPSLFLEDAGRSWSLAIDSALSIAQSQDPNVYSHEVPQFSNYGNGIYQSRYVGSFGNGWESIGAGNNAASSGLYSDYHDYYVNGTKSYSSMVNYYPWFKGAISNWDYHYVTNYQLKMTMDFQIYSLVHNTDITRKILAQLLGANNTKHVCSYFWYKQEPNEADFEYVRKQVRRNGGLWFGDRNRLEVAPSVMYSMAVWSMAYCDGIYLWHQSFIGEEVTAARLDVETAPLTDDDWEAKWGDTSNIGKSSLDWAYVGYFHAKQNEDIISANTQWLTPNIYMGGSWTSGTADYPVMLYNAQKPLCRYKLSANGTEALVLIINPFNNGYTKDTFTVRLPAKNNYEFTVDVWGNFTTVLRLKNL
jgi:hypothetical protein